MDNLKFCNAVCNCVKLFLCPTLSGGAGEEITGCVGEERTCCAGEERTVCAGEERTGCAGEERTGCAGDLRSEMVWDQLERCWSQLLGNFTRFSNKEGNSMNFDLHLICKTNQYFKFA